MRDKIKFDLKYGRAILSKKKKATIRVGERKYTNEVKIYVGERFAGKAKVVKQFPFRIKNLQDWMVRKEGMSRKALLKELARIYGKITNKLFTFVEFDLEPVYFVGIDLKGENALIYIIDGAEKKVVAKKLKLDEVIQFVRDFDPRTVAINCDKEEVYQEGEIIFIGDCEDSLSLLRKMRNKVKGKVILTNSKFAKRLLKVKAEGAFGLARVAAIVAYLHFLGETEEVSGLRVPKEM